MILSESISLGSDAFFSGLLQGSVNLTVPSASPPTTTTTDVGDSTTDLGLLYGVIFGTLLIACAVLVVVILALKYVQMTRRDTDKGMTLGSCCTVAPFPLLLLASLLPEIFTPHYCVTAPPPVLPPSCCTVPLPLPLLYCPSPTLCVDPTSPLPQLSTTEKSNKKRSED